MSVRFTPWTRQPNQTVRIRAELANSFAYGFVGGNSTAINGSSLPAFDKSIGPLGITNNTPSGVALSLTSNADALMPTGSEVTIICNAYLRSGAGGYIGNGRTDSADFNIYLPYSSVVYFRWGGETTGTTAITASGLTFSNTDTWAFTAGHRGMEIWQNGKIVASNTAYPSRTSGSASFYIGSQNGSSLSVFETSLFAVFSRQLPSSLLSEKRYWGIFAPQVTYVPYSTAVGGGADVSLSGISASIASAAGSIMVNVPIAGSSAAVANASGSLSVTVNLSTAALAAAAATGALTLSTQLSGSAAAVAADAGALSVNVPLSGSAAAVAADTGALSITVLISGAAVAAAAATGMLTTGTLIIGAATSVATATGAISIGVPLTGNATATAGASGGIGLIIPVSGAAAAVSSGTGNLSLSGIIQLASLAQAVAAGAGTISLTIPLSGAALAQAVATASFAGTVSTAEVRIRDVLALNRIRAVR